MVSLFCLSHQKSLVFVMLPGLNYFPAAVIEMIASLMKLVLALGTSTNADHEVSTIIFFIITKKKKPNIKKAQC